MSQLSCFPGLYTVSCRTSFFSPWICDLCTLCLGHKSERKNGARNIQYGPQTWVVGGIYLPLWKQM